MRTALFAIAAFAVAAQADLVTQSRDSVVGSWKLVEASATEDAVRGSSFQMHVVMNWLEELKQRVPLR